MTKEEAILILEEEAEFLYGDFLPGNAPYNKTAFDMAIEALQRDIHRYEMVIRASERYLGVVRCKDCEYADFESPYPVCNLIEVNINDNDFCSWGEREEE